MRCFIALEIPEEVSDYINRIAADMSKYVNGNYVPEMNRHVTLAFLGDVEPTLISRVCDIIRDTVNGMKPCDVSLQKFILLQKSSIAALEIKKNSQIAELATALRENLIEAGFNLDVKEFRPHITVARRISYDLPYREICKLLTIYNRPHLSDEVTLYCSTLGGEHAVYQALGSFKLRG